MTDEKLKPALTEGDLLVLRADAGKRLMEMPGGARLNGSQRPLDATARLSLAWLRAALQTINHKGGLRPGFLEEFQQKLDTPDSDCEAEEHEWTEVADPKARKP
jgi:hypothetical protein